MYYTKLPQNVQYKYNFFIKKELDDGFWMLDTRKSFNAENADYYGLKAAEDRNWV
jgi:hypothetical protein